METRIEVLFCYAREDEALRRRLERQLRALARQDLIKLWYDREISAGTEREREIDRHLDTAQVILLLISPDFIASDYCYGREVIRVMERHERGEARVIPVILSPVIYEKTPFSKLQVLPKNAKPIITWRNKELAFYDVAQGILKAIQELEAKGVYQVSNDLKPELDFPLVALSSIEDTYRKFWSANHRGLMVLMLDQSGSMLQEVQVGSSTYTNGQMATAALNDLIYSTMTKIPLGEDGIKDFYDILVLGYGDDVIVLLHNGSGRPVSVRELEQKMKGLYNVSVDRYDHKQAKVIRFKEKRPYWIDYSADSNRTEMALALRRATVAVVDWLKVDRKRFDSFPPLVINITDGTHNGRGDPIEEAYKLRHLYTIDGHVLLFNCHLTSNQTQQRIAFPKSSDVIDTVIADPDERKWAKQLFAMSSIIPKVMLLNAKSYAVSIEDGARGFLYNASPSDLAQFLRWGTRPLE